MLKIKEWIKRNWLLLVIIVLVIYFGVWPKVQSEGFELDLGAIGGIGRRYIIEGTVVYGVDDFVPLSEEGFLRIKLSSVNSATELEIPETDTGEEEPELKLSDIVKSGWDIPVKIADRMLLLVKAGDKVNIVCKEGESYFFDCKLNEFVFN